jgi:hypothetical protein
MNASRWLLPLTLLVSAACTNSGETELADGGGTDLVRRRGSVIVEACALDSTQRATLEAPGARRLLQDVVLSCLTVDENGQVTPTDTDRRETLRGEVSALRGLGYRVLLGVGLGSSRDAPYSAERGAATLASADNRARAIAELGGLAADADGVDLIVAPLPSASREDVTAYVTETAERLGKDRVELFVPPSLSSPSDLPGGEAFDLQALGPLVSRFRVMTLDYSCCPGPGPTFEPSWGLDVLSFMGSTAPGTPLDFSYPLYGTDFGPAGQRSLTWLEATGLASANGATVRRSPTGAPTFQYRGEDGIHDVYFDDAPSTSLVLSAYDGDVLPGGVGVTFYGLGAEQPGLFEDLSRRTP